MSPLYKLPTGEWIDLADVHSINPVKKGDYEKSTDRVLIGHRNDNVYLVPFDDFPSAQAYADFLGGEVNAARGGV